MTGLCPNCQLDPELFERMSFKAGGGDMANVFGETDGEKNKVK